MLVIMIGDLSMNCLYRIVFFCLMMGLFVYGQNPKPGRGYPEEVKFVKTDCKLREVHVGTIENAPSDFDALPKMNYINEKWICAKVGDELYGVKREERWVYYNRRKGYLIANTDDFLR